MKIELKEILVKEIISGYQNTAEEGVVGYGGLLNIRPKYQREFVYKDHQRDSVIHSIRKDYPLNVMYWVENADGTFEVLDGQQRTISICEYVKGNFPINFQYFHNLPADQQEQILNYEVMIYFCEGTDSEKLEWFKTINIAGEKLADQELRNAVYTGTWLTDAKRYFSKTGCAAYNIGQDYLSGIPIRQDYLETAIRWISEDKIEEYMAKHQQSPNAGELWLYFNSLINWVKVVFPTYRKEMKSVNWGALYNRFKNTPFDSATLEAKITILMQDEDVTKKPGIYSYVLDNQEKHLSVRAFTDKMKREAYERQKGICVHCSAHFELSGMEADHITPWHGGGKTTADNCQMLCKGCNRKKSGK